METQLNALIPQSWLQVERGKLSKSCSHPSFSSSIESLIKVPEPQILPFFIRIDYVEVLAQIHEELETCAPVGRSTLYLLQFQSPRMSLSMPHESIRLRSSPWHLQKKPSCPCLEPFLFVLQSSSSSPGTNHTITKDKCVIQVPKKSHPDDACIEDVYNAREDLENNPIVGACRCSFELKQRRFVTSSYQQRAEALEGLLEFSSCLLQQDRLEELRVLQKPFGPQKVSPQETAIWLTTSFKDTGLTARRPAQGLIIS